LRTVIDRRNERAVNHNVWRSLAPDRRSPAPLYYQLAAAIREQIRAGVLRPGSQLPAERELAEHAGISRMTARQALADLVRSGDVVSRHGVGTFVAEPKLTHDALHLLGFTEEMARVGGAVSSHVIEQGVCVPPAPVARALHLGLDEEAVRIVRLRAAGGTPLLLETSVIPRRRSPGLEHEDLEHQSLYALLATRFGYRLSSARQTIEAIAASAFESGLLDVAEGSPLLLLEGVAETDLGVPVEWFQAIYRADRIKIGLENVRETSYAAVAAPLSVVLTT
jgi:GntR family transcriptional regulator